MNDIRPINVNGYDTYYSETKDARGLYLLIAIPENANKDISDICGTFVNGHMIKAVDYCNSDDVKFIKAYF